MNYLKNARFQIKNEHFIAYSLEDWIRGSEYFYFIADSFSIFMCTHQSSTPIKIKNECELQERALRVSQHSFCGLAASLV